MALLGYTRMSTAHQDAQLQTDALLAAGVHPEHLFPDVVSGSKEARIRSGMQQLLAFARSGDTDLLRVFWTAELVDFSTLPVLAVDNHSGLRWAGDIRVRSAGGGCCRTLRYIG
ncbi:hypothetical protein E3T35_03560 [Cryobacterium sp. TMT1-2-2]|nr:hypothetical protein E3T29_06835 [Cryobacterium sp. TMT1-66-1]TFD14473.1 hypothetical protein E3T35_03560 [Cryobacterium sp. TMT1-2-2]